LSVRVGEYDSTGAALREYVWLGNLPVAMFTPDPAQGANAGTAPPLVYFIHADHLNTPRVLVDKTNTMRWRWMSEPFGTTPAETSPAGLAPLTFNLRFPGQFFDAESGMHYNTQRDYIPGIGRYAQSDPIGLGGGINTFGYVGGNPLSYSDPLGLQAFAPTPWGPMLMPIPVTPGGQSHAPVPGWDPADGPAPTPGTGTIIWPPGFSPNPEPTQCRIDVPPPKPIVPPKPDCEQQLKSCMAIAKAQKSIFMSGACFVAYGICKKVFQ
jgi:RHS repeat-associated protein